LTTALIIIHLKYKHADEYKVTLSNEMQIQRKVQL